MCVLAGIDLLGKFLAGSDTGSVGGRFCGYIEKYMPAAKCEKEVLWKLRNSLMHSFGWYSNAYHFRLSLNGPLVKQRPGSVYLINIRALLQEFVDSAARYKADLLTGPNTAALKTNFSEMYSLYGSIDIRSELIEDAGSSTPSSSDIGSGFTFSCGAPDSSGRPY